MIIRDNIDIFGYVLWGSGEVCAMTVSHYTPIPHIVLGLYLTVTGGLYTLLVQLYES